MLPYATLGSWIKQRRKALDLTQTELAEKIGYAVSTVRKIESGELRPSREVAERLATSLDIQSSELPAFLHLARTPHLDYQAAQTASSVVYRPLPSATIALVGREYELSFIKRQLQHPDIRLITLLGPPGIGKTRLAIAVAQALEHEFPQGICYVPLEHITDPAVVLLAIGEQLEAGDHAASTLISVLAETIHQQHILLILDNMEQVLEAGPDIAALLQLCPRLKILVTSRSLLRVPGEYEIPVVPLTKPPLAPIPPWESLEIYDAVQLFVSSARLVQPAFRITPENAAAVATICARLDGLPLAIELIASRIKVLPPQLLLERLEILLETAYNKHADRPVRQQTLRAAIEWSYRLLSVQEQHMFWRLSIFEASFNFEAVAQIYTAIPDAASNLEEHLEALLNHSMIQCQSGWNGESRFTMLSILREYARELLTTSGTHHQVATAYRNYYVRLAEQAQAHFRGPQEQLWLDKLNQEHDTLRGILQWAIQTSNPSIALRLSGIIWRFWMLRGYVSEGRRWIEQALAIPAVIDPATLASALHAAGALASIQADYRQALDYYDQCLSIRREIDDQAGLAVTLLNYGAIVRQQGRYLHAETILTESMTLYQKQNHVQGIAMALTELGMVAENQGKYQLSARYYHEAMDIQRQRGNEFAIANLLALQGWLEYSQQQYDQAGRLFAEALAMQRTLGDLQNIVRPLDGLAALMFAEGKLVEARAYWLECLNHARAVKKIEFIIKVLEGFAQLAGASEQIELAARLWGYTEENRGRIPYPASPLVQQRYRHIQAQVQQYITTSAWVAAWNHGRIMSMDQAIALVFTDG